MKILFVKSASVNALPGSKAGKEKSLRNQMNQIYKSNAIASISQHLDNTFATHLHKVGLIKSTEFSYRIIIYKFKYIASPNYLYLV